MLKSKKGFTLMEATIALALWMILSVGVLLTWHHVSQSTAALRAHQSAFENARVAMDAIIINVQMAERVEVINDNNGIMRELIMWGLNPQGELHPFTLRLPNFEYSHLRFRRLEFPNPGNELASNIAEIRITYIEGSRLDIFVKSGCYPAPIELEGSVDVRYKYVTVYPSLN